jgi:sugar phosphate isomerase/epimerase
MLKELEFLMSDIKIGWQVGLGHLPFEKVLAWAESVNVQTLELSGSPKNPHTDVDKILAGGATQLKGLLEQHHLKAETIGYCVNHLDPNEKLRNERKTHMLKVIDAAQMMEIPIVACFVGGMGGGLFENMAAVEEHFIPILEHARDHNIKMAIENCPAGGWNIANNPGVWDTLFFEVCEEFDNFGLEFDPSHLVWLQVDYMQALKEFAEKGKVFCCHAKDAIIFPEVLKREGFYGLAKPWWHYKMPGKGVVDWMQFMAILKAAGFKGAVQIEHEDPEYSGAKYQEGVELGLKTLYEALK